MAITLRQLQIFCKVAELASVTRAAEALNLTQSAISMSLNQLENHADSPLFLRQGNRIILNDRGRQLLPLSSKLLVQQQEIEMFLDESLRQPIGILHVGASTTIGNYLMPGLIADFTSRHPGARIQLQVGNATQIENGVRSGELDLGLSEGYQQIPSLNAHKWRDDELVIITGPHHPWTATGTASRDELRAGQWIMREKGSGTRDVFEAALKRENLSCAVTLELGHTEAIKKAVEAEAGCACLSRMAVQRELDHGWLIEITTPLCLKRDLIILSRDENYRSVLFQTFFDSLQQVS